ncbi:hypothetical protein [Agromyces sp. NPDC058064]|uniref:hypothetical protein n=1 Tax=Agromyces sp. NPDC058064 TaxID=3346322 RepID=UPI0036D87AE1
MSVRRVDAHPPRAYQADAVHQPCEAPWGDQPSGQPLTRAPGGREALSRRGSASCASSMRRNWQSDSRLALGDENEPAITPRDPPRRPAPHPAPPARGRIADLLGTLEDQPGEGERGHENRVDRLTSSTSERSAPVFVIESDPARPRKRRVVDRERDAALVPLGMRAYEAIRLMKLEWGGRVIPFEYDLEPVATKAGRRFVGHVIGFGTSMLAAEQAGTSGYRFVDEEERRAAERLAAEALLVYGDFYDGLDHPDGVFTVEVPTKHGSSEYTRSSFG